MTQAESECTAGPTEMGWAMLTLGQQAGSVERWTCQRAKGRWPRRVEVVAVNARRGRAGAARYQQKQQQVMAMQKMGRGAMQRRGTRGRGGSGQSEGRRGGSRRRGTPTVALLDGAKQAAAESCGRSRGRRRTWHDLPATGCDAGKADEADLAMQGKTDAGGRGSRRQRHGGRPAGTAGL